MKMDICGTCRAEALTLQRVAVHSHDVSGIAVELKNAACQYSCSECGEVAIVIPNHEGLVAAVALVLAQSPSKLNGVEARFLRKALGLTAVELGLKLGVSPEHMSRWERGHLVISSAHERHLRGLVAIDMQDKAPAIDVDIKAIFAMELSPLRDPGPRAPLRFELVKLKERENRLKRDQWDTAEALAA
jgi:putative zinc finger/helix-turn-helix YgiT family protein